MITDINQLDLSKTYTYSDYLTWQFDEMVELIKGKIYKMSPAPGSRHQIISRNLQHFISNFLWKKQCQFFSAPFDVRFVKQRDEKEIKTIVQPDLCVVCDPYKIDEKGCLGAPDFIIEIFSPATSRKDTHEKFNLYEEFGVGEYWMVSPSDNIVDVFLLENGRYSFKGKFASGDVLPVYTLPGLEINLSDVFE